MLVILKACMNCHTVSTLHNHNLCIYVKKWKCHIAVSVVPCVEASMKERTHTIYKYSISLDCFRHIVQCLVGYLSALVAGMWIVLRHFIYLSSWYSGSFLGAIVGGAGVIFCCMLLDLCLKFKLHQLCVCSCIVRNVSLDLVWCMCWFLSYV